MGIRPRRIPDPEERIVSFPVVRELLNEEGTVVYGVDGAFHVVGVRIETADPRAVIRFRMFSTQR